jgi:hypothetical protein
VIQHVASVIGKIVAAFPGTRFGKLHYRELERCKSQALVTCKGNYLGSMSLTPEAKLELIWWVENIDDSFNVLTEPSPNFRLQSDASGLGWGATDGTTSIGGQWNEIEKQKAVNNEINFLELLAVFLAVKAFCSHRQNTTILVQVDNTTAVAYINGMGGSKSVNCNLLARDLWAWCIVRNIWIQAVHIPGVLNVVADTKSRKFNLQTEWKLNVDIFKRLCHIFGTPSIDLFASRLNAQLARYISWHPDPEAESVDAFSVNWGVENFYAFPPFCLISKCLQKIFTEQATGLLIVPYWPTQPWFARCVQMLVDIPVILTRSKRLLIQPGTGECHPMCSKLFLVCCRLSGISSVVKVFQQQLATSSSVPGDGLLFNSTAQVCHGGFSFVREGLQIPYKQI